MPFFIRKVPLKASPPQLLEASYAPDYETLNVTDWLKGTFTRCDLSCTIRIFGICNRIGTRKVVAFQISL